MWRKQNRLQRVIVILIGFVSLILLAGLVLFIIVMVSRGQDRITAGQISFSTVTGVSVAARTPDSVVDNYIKTLTEANTSLQTIGDSAKAIEQIADTLFEVRVPKELLDLHLSAALLSAKLKALAKEGREVGPSDVGEVRTLIEYLIEQARMETGN